MANSTWNPSDKTANLTLTGGNLIATTTSSVAAWVRTVDAQTAGKFYWEITCNTIVGANSWVGVATSFNTLTGSSTFGACWAVKSSTTTIDGAPSGTSLGTWANGDVICIAVDCTARLIWFRRGAAGNWNGSAGNNPATGTGGLSAGSIGGAYSTYPAVHLQTSADQVTANFGDTAFAGTVPSGFTSGWPTGTASVTNALATQAALEQWARANPDAQVTQVALEQWASVATAAAPTGRAKVWTGSAWVLKPVKVWSGSAWAVKPVKVWNGSAWV